VIEMVWADAVKLVKLFVVLKPFLEQQMLTYKALKLKSLKESFFLGNDIEGVSMCSARGLK
jgi:hypothetical protein